MELETIWKESYMKLVGNRMERVSKIHNKFTKYESFYVTTNWDISKKDLGFSWEESWIVLARVSDEINQVLATRDLGWSRQDLGWV